MQKSRLMSKPFRTILTKGIDNCLILLGQEVSTEDLTVEMKRITRRALGAKSPSLFVDIGTLNKATAELDEKIIGIAKIKLFLEGSEVHIQIDYINPITFKSLKTEKDSFIYSDTARDEAVEDIINTLMPAINEYKKVIQYGC